MRVVTRIVLAGMMLAAGCSDDGDTADPSTTTPPPTTSTTTTSTTTSTTVAPTTSTSPTTTASPSSSTTLPTTTHPKAALLTESAVVSAAREMDQAFLACAVALPECDLDGLSEWFTGEQLRTTRLLFDTFIDAGLRVREVEGRRFVVVSAELAETRASGEPVARTVECLFDNTVVFTEEPDGSETVVEDGVQTNISEATYVVEDGRWKLRNSVDLEQIGGEDQCPQ